MTKLQVTCIKKDSTADRISHIGGLDWSHSEETAIEHIKSQINEYYVSKDNNIVAIIISSRNGKEYLKTEIDGTTADNLLSLPFCF